jgi:hypothetical protein
LFGSEHWYVGWLMQVSLQVDELQPAQGKQQLPYRRQDSPRGRELEEAVQGDGDLEWVFFLLQDKW